MSAILPRLSRQRPASGHHAARCRATMSPGSHPYRYRDPRDEPDRKSSRSRRRWHRSLVASLAVAPGALLTGWGVVIGVYGPTVGIAFGWLLGLGAALIFSLTAYVLTEIVPRTRRTAATVAVMILFHLIYLAIAVKVLLANR